MPFIMEVADIRWFTPEEEVDLCGHATLATSYVLLIRENQNTSTRLQKQCPFNCIHIEVAPYLWLKKVMICRLNFPVDDLNQDDFNLSHYEVWWVVKR